MLRWAGNNPPFFMSKTPQYDAKVKEILDSLEPGERTCKASGKQWQMNGAEIELYKRYNIPSSPYSPDARQKLHGAFYTAFSWWWHADKETGEKLITHIHPHTGFTVMKDENWYKKDMVEYGQDIDSEKKVIDQMYELALSVPLSAHKNFEKPVNSISRASFGDENSVFTVATHSKRCCYTENVIDAEDTVEAVFSNKIRSSYNVVHSHRIFDCRYVRECFDCMSSWFIFDCRDCEFCFGAWNKRHKKYLWFNEQLTKEEWEKRFAEVDTSSHKVLDQHLNKFVNTLRNDAVWPNSFMTKCQNSTGDYIISCVDCDQCFGCEGSQNEHRTIWDNGKSEYNAYCLSPGSSYCYNSSVVINCSRSHYCHFVSNSQNMEYCEECQECENCFGCFGLRHKKFCIFNKEYSEDEYWEKLDQIKCAMLEQGDYGNFFHGKFAHTPCDLTNGMTIYEDFSEQEKQELKILDFAHELDDAYGDWSGREFSGIEAIPDSSQDVDESFKKLAFKCPETGRPFTYNQLELDLCKKMKVPLPKKHFIPRVMDLWFELNMNTYESGACQNCQADVVYSKNRLYPNKKIYCQDCYLNHLEKYG
jgi:hypothetical protein